MNQSKLKLILGNEWTQRSLAELDPGNSDDLKQLTAIKGVGNATAKQAIEWAKSQDESNLETKDLSKQEVELEPEEKSDVEPVEMPSMQGIDTSDIETLPDNNTDEPIGYSTDSNEFVSKAEAVSLRVKAIQKRLYDH